MDEEQLKQQMIDAVASLKTRLGALKRDLENSNEFMASEEDIQDVSERIETLEAMAQEGDVQNGMGLYTAIDQQLNDLMSTETTPESVPEKPKETKPKRAKKTNKSKKSEPKADSKTAEPRRAKFKEMREAIKEFGSDKDKAYVKQFDKKLAEIQDLKQVKAHKLKSNNPEDHIEAEKIDAEMREIADRYSPKSTFAKVVRNIFGRDGGKIRKKWEEQIKKEEETAEEKENDRLQKVIDDKTKQFEKQEKIIRRGIEKLKAHAKKADVDRKGIENIEKTVKEAKEEFDELKKKKPEEFDDDRDVQKQYAYVTNKINPLITSIKRLMSGERHKSKEEINAEKAARDEEWWDQKAGARDKEILRRKAAAEKKTQQKPSGLMSKIKTKKGTPAEFTPDAEPTPEPDELAEPTPEEEPVQQVGLDKQINQIDAEFEAGNKNELDPELANYARGLVDRIVNPEDEVEARKAIDATLDGYTLEEFLNSQSLTESCKMFKKRILGVFRGAFKD